MIVFLLIVIVAILLMGASAFIGGVATVVGWMIALCLIVWGFIYAGIDPLVGLLVLVLMVGVLGGWAKMHEDQKKRELDELQKSIKKDQEWMKSKGF